MRNPIKALIFMLLAAAALSSCKYLNPSVMLRTKRNYPYAQGVDSLPSRYLLQRGDLITMRVFANEGFRIVDLTTVESGGVAVQAFSSQNNLLYVIEPDSSVNLPIIGRVKVAGMNLTEAELLIEDRYRNYYNQPFVMLQVQNRRITVFPGEGGAAQVIQLQNEQVSLIEALAMAGGISNGGKAYKVKVIRGHSASPEIFFIDLSTPEKFAEANVFYVRANDIVYVEPSYFAGERIVNSFAQAVSLVSSTILTVLLVLQVTSTQ